tara:strand:+ start:726 stop:1391 length:666 start_codon:yes stop_codon:yes gene_type:complete
MITFTELQEGVYDPNIFKAFFLAGGPGSGKSYVVRKTTGGMGMKVVNSDDIFEKLLDKEGLSKKMPESEKEPRDIVRAKAKRLTSAKKANYLEGRLGLIIDGTGKDYDKIAGQATKLKQIGYDVHMIFVNTSLDVALERNQKRERTVPESITIKSWNDVQRNIGKFSQYFRQNFIVVDNNDANEDVFTKVFKQIKSLVRKKVSNPVAKMWIASELEKKKRR